MTNDWILVDTEPIRATADGYLVTYGTKDAEDNWSEVRQVSVPFDRESVVDAVNTEGHTLLQEQIAAEAEQPA